MDASDEDLLEHRTLDAGDVDLEHEPIELRFGKRIGAFELDRILRRQHEERIGQRPRLAERRHAPFLHRLEQRRLGLGRGAVDLVGQQQVGEDRAGVEHELLAAVALLEDVAAGDVGREQVGRELDAAEVERQQPRQRLDELGLAESGKAFEQHMASSEQRGDDLVDRLLLAEDHPAQLVDEPRDLRLAVGDAFGGKECSTVSRHRSAHFSKYFFTALWWRGASVRRHALWPATAAYCRAADGALGAGDSRGAPGNSTTGAQSSGLRAAPGGSGCALNRSNGNDSLPQVSGASARPRLMPPLPGFPSPSGD